MEQTIRIKLSKDLSGSILDIGGGGEGVIGRLYGKNVLAIDSSREELDEAPACCEKRCMDAAKLLFPAESFDNATFFYSLMYMDEGTQAQVLQEAYRVLKPGGRLSIWDCGFASAYPDPHVVDLMIELDQNAIRTSYGIVKMQGQSLETVARLAQDCGFVLLDSLIQDGQFHLAMKKP